jgi:hypothetical protein
MSSPRKVVRFIIESKTSISWIDNWFKANSGIIGFCVILSRMPITLILKING